MAHSIHVKLDKPRPWQHCIGKRCTARLSKRPTVLRRRKPRVVAMPGDEDRTVAHLEAVDAAPQPEAD